MSNETIGLVVLIIVGAIVVGYLMSCIVPASHYPRTAGVLATNAVIGGLAYAGVSAAGDIILWFAIASIFAIGAALETDSR